VAAGRAESMLHVFSKIKLDKNISETQEAGEEQQNHQDRKRAATSDEWRNQLTLIQSNLAPSLPSKENKNQKDKQAGCCC